MRIIAGSARGRKLTPPAGNDVRPTSDKVRGAIFNSLRSKGAVMDAVLDCFCGSGALGLEALSQGAKTCVFIDDNRDSLDLAKKNAAALKFESQCAFFLKNMRKLKERPEKFPQATLVFLDPPYNKKLVLPALENLSEGGWIARGATIVVEAERSFNEIIPPPFTVVDEKTYGDTKVIFLSCARM